MARTSLFDLSGRVAVVTGAGNKSFSAGGDFFAMKRLNFTNAYMWNDRMLGLAMTIRGLPIPVIAMVNGPAIAGTFEIALACGNTAAEKAAEGVVKKLKELLGERHGACGAEGQEHEPTPAFNAHRVEAEQSLVEAGGGAQVRRGDQAPVQIVGPRVIGAVDRGAFRGRCRAG